MGKITGFLEIRREGADKRPATERVRDWKEFDLPVVQDRLAQQGARCMDCGIPFCNSGCPLGNLIPEWNDAVFRDCSEEAIAALHATNNFPEVTGRVCPAPCESACVLGINDDPVSIKLIEKSVADRAFLEGLVRPHPPAVRTGKRVAVIGSGPAGLAAAQQLNRAGHQVTLLERDDRLGGLMTYGIPDFKLDKSLIERRVDQMRVEGVEFRTNVNVGVDITGAQLRSDFDAVCVAIGSRHPRDLDVPGRQLSGIHFAMDFLEQANRRVAGETIPDEIALEATGKHVIVIGGGDTGSDCIGTSHRQGAKSVTSLEIMPRPPERRSPSTPWPMWQQMLRTSSSHEEGGSRRWSVSTESFAGKDGRVTTLNGVDVELVGGRVQRVDGTEFELKADLVLLAMGFLHPERPGLLEQLGAELDGRGNLKIDDKFMTSLPGVFAAGDCQRGQSLIVWAIADGRRAARAVDVYLMGRSDLP